MLNVLQIATRRYGMLMLTPHTSPRLDRGWTQIGRSPELRGEPNAKIHKELNR